MPSNCGITGNSWKSLGHQGDQSNQSLRKSTLKTHWKDWCWCSNTLSTWCKEPTHWKRLWCWERLRVREGDNRKVRWLYGIINSMDMRLSKLGKIVKNVCTAVLGVAKSWKGLNNNSSLSFEFLKNLSSSFPNYLSWRIRTLILDFLFFEVSHWSHRYPFMHCFGYILQVLIQDFHNFFIQMYFCFYMVDICTENFNVRLS